MSKVHPLLLVLLPPDWEVDPAALRSLKQFVGDEYDAGLWIRLLGYPAPGSRVQLLGDWGSWSASEVHARVAGHLAGALIDLDWLEASA